MNGKLKTYDRLHPKRANEDVARQLASSKLRAYAGADVTALMSNLRWALKELDKERAKKDA